MTALAVSAWSTMKRALLLAGLLLLAALPVRAQPVASPDDTARILAGMPPSTNSPLAILTRDKSWQFHQSQFDKAFGALETRQLSKMRTWSVANLTAPQPVLFYMFSGPDFLHADVLFPNADTYVLAALEPVDSIPDLLKARDALPAMLDHLRNTMRSSLAFSFFITREMREEMGVTRLSGVLPILYVHLARSGKMIHEVSPAHIDDKGNVWAGNSARSGARGVRIVFSGDDGRERLLYYFTTNIANDGFRRSGFAAFCENLGRADAILKSASYLLHQNGFTHVRDFLLARSATILQDNSGVPVSKFDPSRWTLRTYGRGMDPIGEFANYPQPMLKEFYRQHMQGPLDFGFGYRHRSNETGLLVAARREQPRLETTAAGGSPQPAPVKRAEPRQATEIAH